MCFSIVDACEFQHWFLLHYADVVAVAALVPVTILSLDDVIHCKLYASGNIFCSQLRVCFFFSSLFCGGHVCAWCMVSKCASHVKLNYTLITSWWFMTYIFPLMQRAYTAECKRVNKFILNFRPTCVIFHLFRYTIWFESSLIFITMLKSDYIMYHHKIHLEEKWQKLNFHKIYSLKWWHKWSFLMHTRCISVTSPKKMLHIFLHNFSKKKWYVFLLHFFRVC